jgi:hypothetical protein
MDEAIGDLSGGAGEGSGCEVAVAAGASPATASGKRRSPIAAGSDEMTRARRLVVDRCDRHGRSALRCRFHARLKFNFAEAVLHDAGRDIDTRSATGGLEGHW